MALSKAHLDALGLAIASGTLSVSFEGHTHMSSKEAVAGL